MYEFNPFTRKLDKVGTGGGTGGGIAASLSGNTAGVMAVVSSGTMYLAGGNNVTLSQNANSITISGANAGGAQTGISALYDGANSISSGTVRLTNANGVTFTLNGNTLSGSVNTSYRASNDAIGLNTAQSNVTWTANSAGLSLDARGYAGTNTATTGGLSVTLNSSGISLNAPSWLTTAAQSSASNVSGVIAATASNGATNQSAQLSGAVSFSNTNGVSFFTSANGAVSGIAATVKTDYQSSNANYLTSQSNQALSGSNGSFTFQTATITGSGAVQVYTTNGSSLVVSAPTQTVQPVAVSGANGSYAFSTLSLSNANGVSFGTSAGSAVTASYTVPTVTQYFSKTNTTFNGANISGSITNDTNGLNLSLSVAAPGGGATPAASASNGSFTFSTLGFSNANNVTFGTSVGSIITASVAAPGAAAENNWVNLLGANTAGNTTASGSTIGYSGINLTLSGTNGSAINISAPATSSLSATGGISLSTNGSTISIGLGQPLSRFEYPEGIFTALSQTGMGSLSLNHVYVPFNVTATAMKIGGSLSAATNTSATTASANVSLLMGIYTLNGSTLSLASSGSANNGFAWSQAAGSTTANTSINSMRQMTVPININMTPGQYWIGAVITQQTTYTSYGYTIYGNDRIASAGTNAVLSPIGSGTTAARDVMLFQGIYTAATASLPGAIQNADINNTSASNVQRANFYWAAYNATY